MQSVPIAAAVDLNQRDSWRAHNAHRTWFWARSNTSSRTSFEVINLHMPAAWGIHAHKSCGNNSHSVPAIPNAGTVEMVEENKTRG